MPPPIGSSFSPDDAVRIARVVRKSEAKNPSHQQGPMGRPLHCGLWGTPAVIVNAPAGATAVSGAMYYVQFVISDNDEGDAPSDPVAFTTPPQNVTTVGGDSITNPTYKIVPAGDLGALNTGARNFSVGQFVWVYLLFDGGNPPTPRYFFAGGGGGGFFPVILSSPSGSSGGVSSPATFTYTVTTFGMGGVDGKVIATGQPVWSNRGLYEVIAAGFGIAFYLGAPTNTLNEDGSRSGPESNLLLIPTFEVDAVDDTCLTP